MNEPIHVNDDNFENVVLKSSLPVLVDFWAPWCAPCRILAPSIDKIAHEYAGRLVVAKINTDQNPRWAAHYRISGIPTLLFVSGGRIVHEQVGALSYATLRHIVDQFLSVDKPVEGVAS